jgi:DNA-binding LacI/PurR family transcriptional regulator
MATLSKKKDRTRQTQPVFQLDENSAAPLYRQVQTIIRQHIADGRLRPGDRLPPLLRFSEELGIAYATVARGVRALVEEGVLDARTARGTVVAPPHSRRTHHTGIFGTFPFASLMSETRYYRSLLFLIQETLIERGQKVVYSRWREEALPELLGDVRPVDSAVLFQVAPQRLPQVKEALEAGTPLVCVGDTFHDPDVPAVHTTNRQDTMRAVRLLRARGHTRIAALHLPEHAGDYSLLQRIQGFQEAMSDLAPNCKSVISDSSEGQANHLLALKEPPTAIIMLTQMGEFRELYNGLRGTPLELGRHVEVAAWDENLWRLIEPLDIGYIGIEQPLRQIADIAVGELMRMLDEPSYRSGLIQVSSQIVEVSAEGKRRVL